MDKNNKKQTSFIVITKFSPPFEIKAAYVYEVKADMNEVMDHARCKRGHVSKLTARD